MKMRPLCIIVTRSTTHGGMSRIVAQLHEGAVVTTMKNTVDKVVTEWGVAELRGRTLRERARALISIAHPDHREELPAIEVEVDGVERSDGLRPDGLRPGPPAA